jgi:hypothetical protein
MLPTTSYCTLQFCFACSLVTHATPSHFVPPTHLHLIINHIPLLPTASPYVFYSCVHGPGCVEGEGRGEPQCWGSTSLGLSGSSVLIAVWLVRVCRCEVCLQLPFFPVTAYALATRTCTPHTAPSPLTPSHTRHQLQAAGPIQWAEVWCACAVAVWGVGKEWVRLPLVVYASHVATTLVVILATFGEPLVVPATHTITTPGIHLGLRTPWSCQARATCRHSRALAYGQPEHSFRAHPSK